MKKSLTILVALGVIAVPALVASVVLWHFNGATLFDTLPVQSDEIMYWHQAYTFSEVGFNGGYYTAGELLPRVARFYAWGAAAPVFFGTFGIPFGWPLWAMTVLNIALLCAATAAFIRLARLNIEQMLWLGGLLATFHPFLLYSPTQYLEVFNMALAVLLAALFARLFRLYRSGEPAGRALWITTGVVIFFAALTRFPWALLYTPLLLLTVRPTTLRGWVVSFIQSVGLMLVPVVLYALTSAPYPETIISRIMRNPTLARAGRILGNNIQRNLRLFGDGDHLELHIRFGSAIAVAVLTVVVVAYVVYRLRGSRLSARLRETVSEAALAWYLLAALLAFIVLIYDVHGLRGYRMLSGTLLMLIALCVAFRRRWVLAPLLAYQVIVFPYALFFYDNFTNFQTDPAKYARYEEYQPQLADVLVYDPDAPSPWCNTVLYDLYYLLGETSIMVATPPGIGLSITEAVPNGVMPEAPQSKYIGLRDGNYPEVRATLHLEPLLPLPDGMLYINLDAPCGPPQREGS